MTRRRRRLIPIYRKISRDLIDNIMEKTQPNGYEALTQSNDGVGAFDGMIGAMFEEGGMLGLLSYDTDEDMESE